MSELSTDKANVSRVATPSVSRHRHTWVRILASLIIFVSGVAVGSGVMMIVVRNRVLYAIQHPEKMPARIAGRLRQTLHLDDRQSQAVEEILVQRQHSLQAIRRQFQPEVERELDRVQREVSAVLDEKQRASWREQFAQLRQTWTPPVPAESPIARKEHN